VNRTPRIDEIAEHGVLFESCFATNSLCSPSRATMLTGTYSHVNGVKTLSMAIDSSQPTFVNQLRAAGYRTAIVGKWHLRPRPRSRGLRLLGRQGEYHDPRFLSASGLRTETGYATDAITDLSLAWLE
jgi:arylsulfatase A-like enzyme